MKIGEVAAAAGVSKDTVRYYVDGGLLSATRDVSNGYLRFDLSSVQRLKFIKTAQHLGFRLEDIREVFKDAHKHNSPCPRVRDIIVQRLEETRQRIAELNALCENMERAVASWESMPNGEPSGQSVCQLIESQGA